MAQATKSKKPRPYHIAAMRELGQKFILLSADLGQRRLIFYTHLALVCASIIPRNHKSWRQLIRVRAKQLDMEDEQCVEEALSKLLAEEKALRKKRGTKKAEPSPLPTRGDVSQNVNRPHNDGIFAGDGWRN